MCLSVETPTPKSPGNSGELCKFRNFPGVSGTSSEGDCLCPLAVRNVSVWLRRQTAQFKLHNRFACTSAPVVQRMDNAIHRTNSHPVDECQQNKSRNPLDSDLFRSKQSCCLLFFTFKQDTRYSDDIHEEQYIIIYLSCSQRQSRLSLFFSPIQHQID